MSYSFIEKTAFIWAVNTSSLLCGNSLNVFKPWHKHQQNIKKKPHSYPEDCCTCLSSSFADLQSHR